MLNPFPTRLQATCTTGPLLCLPLPDQLHTRYVELQLTRANDKGKLCADVHAGVYVSALHFETTRALITQGKLHLHTVAWYLKTFKHNSL